MTPSFSNFGLLPILLKNIERLGYKEPSPIQVKAIAPILQGHDVLAAAQTGTGKTAAFGLPLIQKLLQENAPRKERSARALILAPTRELAAQIQEAIRAFSLGTPLKTALVFGGVNIRPQKTALASGIDILVATPGRLLDHIAQRNLTLSDVRFLVLDEADRMLDMGFIRDIRKILALVPQERQTLLFSATFNDEVLTLAEKFLTSPVHIEISKNQDCALVRQEVYFVEKKRKRDLLRDLIIDNNWQQVLVFTRMKHAANRLAEQLAQDGLTTAAIHGNKSQSARTKALSGFKNKTVRVLVATDIAARGLDIQGLPQVVNYELPNAAEDYVHRIGRTGRAGHTGLAVSLVGSEELPELRAVERLLKKNLTIKTIPGYEVPSVATSENSAPKKRAPRPEKRSRRATTVQTNRKGTSADSEKTSASKIPSSAPLESSGEKISHIRYRRLGKIGKNPHNGSVPANNRGKSPRRALSSKPQKALEKELHFETVRSNLPPGIPLSRLQRRR